MQRRNFMLKTTAALAFGGLALGGCTTNSGNPTTPSTDTSKRQSIDASVDGTMSRLFTTVKGSRELVSKARGVLVFPSVLQVGFIVGGQYGEGALRVGGKSVGYYSTVSGSVGFQAGAQSKVIIFLFLKRHAFDEIRH